MCICGVCLTLAGCRPWGGGVDRGGRGSVCICRMCLTLTVDLVAVCRSVSNTDCRPQSCVLEYGCIHACYLLCLCLYLYVFVPMGVCTYECLYLWVFVYMGVCKYWCLYLWVFVPMGVCTYGCLCIWMFVSMGVCTYGCLYLWVFVCNPLSISDYSETK